MAIIKLHQHEVLDAISKHLSDEFGMDIDLNGDRLYEHPSINYHVPEYAYKKTRDGKDKLDKNGLRIVDWKKTKYHSKWIEFDDNSEIEFWI